MFRRNLRSVAARTHVDAGRTIALRYILVAPVTRPFTPHVDALRYAAIGGRMRQFGPARIAYSENVAWLLFFILFVVFHVSLLCHLRTHNRKRQAAYHEFLPNLSTSNDNRHAPCINTCP